MQVLNASTKRYHKTQALNASTKCKHKTLPLNASTNGGDASRVGILRQKFTDKRVISAACEPLLGVLTFALMPDARRVAPIRGSVCCLRLVFEYVPRKSSHRLTDLQICV